MSLTEVTALRRARGAETEGQPPPWESVAPGPACSAGGGSSRLPAVGTAARGARLLGQAAAVGFLTCVRARVPLCVLVLARMCLQWCGVGGAPWSTNSYDVRPTDTAGLQAAALEYTCDTDGFACSVFNSQAFDNGVVPTMPMLTGRVCCDASAP